MFKKIKKIISTFLRQTEKYTKTDMVYLASGGFWLSISKIANSISAFALSVAFANLLSKETYGIYKYVLATAALFSITALPGINTALIKSVALGFEGSIKKAIKIKFHWSLIGGAISLLFSGYYYWNENINLAIGFLIAAISIPLIESFILYGPFLQGRKMFKISAQYSTITQISIALGMIISLFLTNNILIILFIYYFITAAVGLFLMYFTIKKYKFNDKEEANTLKYGKNLSVMNVMGTIASQLDKILLWHFLGAAPLAIYSFAIAPITQFQGILKSVNVLSLPKFATQNPTTIKKTLNKKLILFSLLLLIPVTLYILIAPWLFEMFFPQYLDSIIYSQILAVSLLFFPQRLISQALTAHEQTKSLYKLKFISSLTKIILLFILLPQFGIMGIIISIITTQTINSILLRYYLTKIDN